jgi:lipoprotein-anchoring transpeptidase ErfK/SrfK
MMRKYFAAALAVSLMFAVAPMSVSAVPSKDEAALVLKKKKQKTEIKVLKAKKTLTTSSITPVAKVKPKSVRIIKKPVASPALAQAKPPRACGTFMQCLFGNKRNRARVQNASFTGGAGAVISNRTNREVVAWNESKYPVGSLIVRTPERALYYVSGKGEAVRYSVGVGREGMQWSGNSSIVRKTEWPSWTPPQVMMYIGGGIFRVHGTNNEASIGGAVSSGCIRMMNADVIDLYNRVKIGAKIYVYQ